jgi:ABC-type transporter Mla subunit MlaD
MIYSANVLVTNPTTGDVTAIYWSVEHNGRRRSGTVDIAPTPPFPDEATTVLAAKGALGPAFIALLEDEVTNPPGQLPPMVPNPPPDSPTTVPLPLPPLPPPGPVVTPPGPLPPPGF